MAPRAVWTGNLSFGLVNVPVGLHEAARSKAVSFRQFDRSTGRRVRRRRVAEGTGEEVDYDDIVKGYALDGGEYILLEREELESVDPERTRSIEIEDFVDGSEIDPVFFRRSYYAAPTDDGAGKAYALLAAAMERSGMAGIARFVMRDREHLATVRAVDGVLTLSTMYFADEVRDPAAVEGTAADVDLSEDELETAMRLIESLATDWEPDRYQDRYRERVLDLIERKAAGEDVEIVEPEPEGGDVVDLMAALEASVAEARQRRSDAPDPGAEGAMADAELTKDELYERARSAGIEGRSTMTKPELAEALADAG